MYKKPSLNAHRPIYLQTHEPCFTEHSYSAKLGDHLFSSLLGTVNKRLGNFSFLI